MRRYQSDKLPLIVGFASVGSNAMGPEFNALQRNTNWYPNQMVGIKISVPIFDGFGGTARIQKAKLKFEQAKNDKENISTNLELAFLVNQSNYLDAINKYNHEKNNLILAKKIYEKTLTKYREGLVSSIELSRSGRDYIESNTNLSLSIHNLLISNLNYQRSLGK